MTFDFCIDGAMVDFTAVDELTLKEQADTYLTELDTQRYLI